MAKSRLIEKIITKKDELKKVIGKRVAPMLLAGVVTAGSLFGIAGCQNEKQAPENNNDVKYEEVVSSQQEEINELKELIDVLQQDVDGLKGEVSVKADITTINEINKELLSIAKTLADLTNNIATINNYYLSVKDKIDTTNTKVDNVEKTLNEISTKYDKQQEVLNALVGQIQTLETKVNELSNTNSDNNTNTETDNSDLQSQIGEMKQVVNRLALENAIKNTIHSRYNVVHMAQNNYYGIEYIEPNGNLCAYLEVDEESIYYISEDNFGCMLNTTTGENNIDCGDESSNAFVQFNSILFGMEGLDNCTITKDNDRYTITIDENGQTTTTYVTLDKYGYIKSMQFDDGFSYNIDGISRSDYQMMFNTCKVAQKVYNDLKQIINNSWTDDCLEYSPFTEDDEAYAVYFNKDEGYMYMNEAEYGKTYGVAEGGYTASVTQTSNGELELYEQNSQQNIMQSFKYMILNNGEKMLISYNAENNSYVIEDEDVKIEYIVEDNEIVSIKVTDKENNAEKECVKIMSQQEFKQKAQEIKAKFDELKSEYENSNTLGQ